MLAIQPVLLYVQDNCVRLRNSPSTSPGQPNRGVLHACGLDEGLANSYLKKKIDLKFTKIRVFGATV